MNEEWSDKWKGELEKYIKNSSKFNKEYDEWIKDDYSNIPYNDNSKWYPYKKEKEEEPWNAPKTPYIPKKSPTPEEIEDLLEAFKQPKQTKVGTIVIENGKVFIVMGDKKIEIEDKKDAEKLLSEIFAAAAKMVLAK